jgi:hypothetical protein
MDFYIPEDYILHSQCRQNFKCCNNFVAYFLTGILIILLRTTLEHLIALHVPLSGVHYEWPSWQGQVYGGPAGITRPFLPAAVNGTQWLV